MRAVFRACLLAFLLLLAATFAVGQINENQPPPAPTNVAVTIGNTWVNVTWSGFGDTYEVWRSTTSSTAGFARVENGGASTSFLNTGLSNNTSYWYYVVADNLAGSSPHSAVVKAIPTAPPVGLTATGGTGSISISWSPSAGATAYKVWRGTTSGGPYATPVGTPTTTTCTDTTVSNGTPYYYVVQSTNSTGTSPNSSQATATPIAIPTLSGQDGDGSASLNWTSAAGATTYKLWRGPSGGPYTTPVTTTSSNSYTETGLQDGTTYYYVVQGLNSTGAGTLSSQVAVTPNIPLVAPPNFRAQPHGTSLTLVWDPVATATGYLVSYGAGEPFSQVSVTGTSYTFTSIDPQTAVYRVQATRGPDTGPVSVLSASQYTPYPPSGVTAIPGTSQITIRWTADPSATHYTVKQGTSTGVYTTSYDNLTASTFTATGLANGTTYYFVVTSSNSYGEGWPSGEVNATPGGPPAPTGVTATAGNLQATIAWNAAPSATSYKVYEGTVQGGPYTNIFPTTQTSTIVTGLTNGKPYYFVVTGLNSIGEGPPSSEATATPAPPPSTPQNLTAVAGTSRVNLSWSASQGAASYSVERSTTQGTGYAPLPGNVSTTAYIDATAVNGTTYYYVVTASNSSGSSGNSNEAIATPIASPLVSLLGADASSIKLTWPPAAGAASYTVRRWAPSSPNPQVFAGNPGPTFADTVSPDTVYTYTVSGVNPTGESDQSGTVVAETLDSNLVHVPLGLATDVPRNTAVSSTANDSWEVLQGGRVIATSLNPLGWVVSPSADHSTVNVSAPTDAFNANAPLSMYYFVRMNYGTQESNVYPFVLFAKLIGGVGATFTMGDVEQPASGAWDLAFEDGTIEPSLGWIVNRGQGALLHVVPPLNTPANMFLKVRYQAGTTGISGLVQPVPRSTFVLPTNEVANPLGYLDDPLALPDWLEDTVPSDTTGGPDAGAGSSVNVLLPFGVHETNVGTNIYAHNPLGGDVSFNVTYRTPLAVAGLSSPGLPAGWVHNWDTKLIPASVGWGPLILVYPSGAHETIWPVLDQTGNPTDAFTVPTGAPYVVTGTHNADGWLTVTFSANGDAKEVFQPVGNWLRPTEFVESNGHSISLTYDADSGRLQTISNDGGTTLLSCNPPTGPISYVRDEPGNRSISFDLDSDGKLQFIERSGGGGFEYYQFAYSTFDTGKPLITDVKTQGGEGGDDDALVRHDPDGRVFSVRDGDMHVHVYTYDAQGQVTVHTLKQGYDPGTRADYYSSMDYNISTETADQLGRGIKETSAANDSATTTYDSSTPDVVTKIQPPVGAAATVQIDPADPNHRNPGKVTDPYGTYTLFTWDYSKPGFPFGLLTDKSEYGTDGSLKSKVQYGYYYETNSSLGQFAGYIHTVSYPIPGDQSANPQLQTVTYSYTPMGQVSRIDYPGPNGQVHTTVDYTDANNSTEIMGEPRVVTDPMGRKTLYQYDSNGNVLSVVKDGRETDYTYDYITDQVDTITLPPDDNGWRNRIELTYAVQGKPATSATIHLNDNTTRQISMSRSAEWADLGISGDTLPTTQTLKPDFTPDTVSANGGALHQFTYDYANKKTTTTLGANPDPYANDPGDTSTANFDGNGQPTLTTRPVLPNNPNHYFSFTPDDRVSLVQSDESFQGNSNADQRSFAYDSRGRLSSMTGETAILSGTTVASDTETFPQYDDDGNVLVRHAVASTITYQYLPNGQRQYMTIGGHTFSYTYDDDGELLTLSVTGIAGSNVSYAYNNDGTIKWKLASTVHTFYTYDALGRVTRQLNLSTVSSTPTGYATAVDPSDGQTRPILSDFSGISYDPAGNRRGFHFNLPKLYSPFVQITDPAITGDVVFTYDSHDRLIDESWSPASDPTLGQFWSPKDFTSAYGSPSDLGDNLGQIRNWYTTFNSRDQLTGLRQDFNSNVNDYNFVYDADGNLQAQATNHLLGFDYEDQLVSRSYHDYNSNTNPTMWYGYNAVGQRTSKVADDASTSSDYIWDGDELLAEVQPGGALKTLNIWGADGLVGNRSFVGNQNFVIYVFDPNGSRAEQTEYNTYWWSSIPAVSNELYDAWGRLQYWSDGRIFGDDSVALTNDPYAYKGQAGYHTDPEGAHLTFNQSGDTNDQSRSVTSGLIYCEHRYYSPFLCHWITRDPAGLEGGANLYEYCGDNPVMELDPSGLQGTTQSLYVLGDMHGDAKLCAPLIKWDEWIDSDQNGYSVTEIGPWPAKAKVLSLICEADMVHLFGHSNEHGISIGPGSFTRTTKHPAPSQMQDWLTYQDIALVGKIRAEEGKGKLSFIEIDECYACADPNYVRALLGIAEEVRGYDGLTAWEWGLGVLHIYRHPSDAYTPTWQKLHRPKKGGRHPNLVRDIGVQ